MDKLGRVLLGGHAPPPGPPLYPPLISVITCCLPDRKPHYALHSDGPSVCLVIAVTLE